MEILIKLLIALIAFEHFYICYMEMFAWETLGKKTFRGAIPDEMFAKTKTFAANQGLYNGFLAAGLTWTFFIQDMHWHFCIALFFLSCVSIAGLYGAYSVSKRIFYIQALPALITIILMYIN
ncbi:MAG: DUF1304 domain-containing protein [Bacteroidetes bacterium]|nr:DUF1304 domain-containing protein [Bacteroidota bacterium]MBK8680468.1 DUF1304 domain-containing protein [Bacteroidota bacterium]